MELLMWLVSFYPKKQNRTIKNIQCHFIFLQRAETHDAEVKITNKILVHIKYLLVEIDYKHMQKIHSSVSSLKFVLDESRGILNIVDSICQHLFFSHKPTPSSSRTSHGVFMTRFMKIRLSFSR